MKLPAPVWSVCSALALAGSAHSQGIIASSPRPYEHADGGHRVVIEAHHAESLEALRAAGLVRWEQAYGSFVHVVLRPGGFELIPEHVEAHGADLQDLILIDGAWLDGRTGALIDPDAATPLAPRADRAGLFLVQFRGPIRGAWRDLVESTGASVIEYVPMNTWLVRAEEEAAAALRALAEQDGPVQLVTELLPWMRLAPELRAPGRLAETEPERIHVQLLADATPEAAAEVMLRFDELFADQTVGPYRNLRGHMAGARLLEVAGRPEVLRVGRWELPVRLDERQAQTIAGQVAEGQPLAPGYLDWLASQGFDATGVSDFVVHVVDDVRRVRGHPDLPDERVVFELNPTDDFGPDGGHGFLVANILAGFNENTGGAFTDPPGYRYGLGVAPFARVGVSDIFGPGIAELDPAAIEADAWGLGARLSNNSWGAPLFEYEGFAQTYDFLVRDARDEPGNQQLIIVFGAGNSGPQRGTIFTPAAAKNVISAGGCENFRPTATDGCGWTPADADSVDDVATISSRGPMQPASDGRIKPDVMAPATHVQAGVPQSNWDESGLCDAFFPPGQTLYGWSTGTSFASPAVTGAAALIYQRFLDQGRPAPSPAMVKALLVNGAEHMKGEDAADRLPSPDQGFGRVHMTRSLDDRARILIDQTSVLDETGQEFSVLGRIVDPDTRVRIALAWTDVPGSLVGAPWVNDLDLIVDLEGERYLGNVFMRGTSVTGRSPDPRNNVEAIFLPPGRSGELIVTVRASSIAGDGIPGQGDLLDQDFALVIDNVEEAFRYGCDPANQGSLTVVGQPVIGTQLQFGLDDASGATTPGAIPFLALALAPDPRFPCGLRLPLLSDTELLLAPAALLRPLLRGPGWKGPGQPALLPLVLPDDIDLIGLSLFAQGYFVSLEPGATSLRATDALHLRLGP